jgi:hypothetical protein
MGRCQSNRGNCVGQQSVLVLALLCPRPPSTSASCGPCWAPASPQAAGCVRPPLLLPLWPAFWLSAWLPAALSLCAARRAALVPNWSREDGKFISQHSLTQAASLACTHGGSSVAAPGVAAGARHTAPVRPTTLRGSVAGARPTPWLSRPS